MSHLTAFLHDVIGPPDLASRPHVHHSHPFFASHHIGGSRHLTLLANSWCGVQVIFTDKTLVMAPSGSKATAHKLPWRDISYCQVRSTTTDPRPHLPTLTRKQLDEK